MTKKPTNKERVLASYPESMCLRVTTGIGSRGWVVFLVSASLHGLRSQPFRSPAKAWESAAHYLSARANED